MTNDNKEKKYIDKVIRSYVTYGVSDINEALNDGEWNIMSMTPLKDYIYVWIRKEVK